MGSDVVWFQTFEFFFFVCVEESDMGLEGHKEELSFLSEAKVYVHLKNIT